MKRPVVIVLIIGLVGSILLCGGGVMVGLVLMSTRVVAERRLDAGKKAIEDDSDIMLPLVSSQPAEAAKNAAQLKLNANGDYIYAGHRGPDELRTEAELR